MTMMSNEPDGDVLSSNSTAARVAKAMGGVIKFKEMRPNWQAVPGGDPGFHIPVYKYCDGAEPNLSVAIPPVVHSDEFRLAVGVCEPGRGAPLHNHTGEELMFAASSSWVVFFDEEEENKVYLDPWDAILVPPNVVRGWRNVGRELGCFLNFSAVSDKMTVMTGHEKLET